MRIPVLLAAAFLLTVSFGASAAIAYNDYYYPQYPPQQQGYQTSAYYNFFLDEGGRAFVLLSLDVGSNTQLPTDLTVYVPGADVDMKYVMIQGSTGSGNVDFIANNLYIHTI